MEYSGLTCPRQAPNRPYCTKGLMVDMTGWNGTPFAKGTNFMASAPTASLRFAGGYCRSIDRRRPARSSFNSVEDRLDVKVMM